MSTAGKVLVVLVLLVVPIWILLVSTVAQLNIEWATAMQKQTDQIAKLEKDVADNERAIQELKGNVELTQRSADQVETGLRAKLAEVERAKADTTQIQTGVNIQLETIKSAVQTAETAKTQRTKEKEEEVAAKKAAEDLVVKLKGENSELMDELTGLRKDFKHNLEEAKTLVDRLLKAAPKPARRISIAR